MSFFYSYTYPELIYQHTLSDAPDQAAFERHCHDHFEILYVVRGEGRYMVESAEYPLRPNTLLLIRPYEFHYVCPQSNCAYERHVIHFTSEMLSETLLNLPMMQDTTARGRGVYFSALGLDGEVRSILENLEKSCAIFENSPARRAKEQAMLAADLTRVLLRLSLSEPERTDVSEDRVIARVIEYLNLHLEREISLDLLAQRFFVSKYYLCHAFRKHTGVSVLTYLNTKRIAMAQKMLENGEPANSVAYQVGFRNYSSFYRAFIKQTGHAPVYSREC